MSFNHAVVWIDHRHALVLHFDRENDELRTVNADISLGTHASFLR